MKIDQTLIKAIFQDVSDRQAKSRATKEAAHIGTLLKLYKHRSDKQFSVLNVGCGLGRHDSKLRKLGYTVHSIDIVPGFIKMAKERNPGFEKYYKVGSMTDLPYRDKSFDAVLCLFSAFNIMNDTKNSKALSEFNRVMRNKGLLIMDLETKHKQNGEYSATVGKNIIKVTKNRVVGNYLINEETLFSNSKNKIRKKIAHIVDKERLYTSNEITVLCKKHGLYILNFYRAYTIRKLNVKDSQMLIVAIKKH